MLAALAGGALVDRGDRVVIEVDDPTEPLLRLCGWARERGLELDGLEVVRPSLEDVYLDLVGAERPPPSMQAAG